MAEPALSDTAVHRLAVGPLRPRWPGVRRIAVLRGGGLGDLLFAMPAVHALAAAYPEADIVLLGSALHAQLLNGRPTPIGEVVVLPESAVGVAAPGTTACVTACVVRCAHRWIWACSCTAAAVGPIPLSSSSIHGGRSAHEPPTHPRWTAPSCSATTTTRPCGRSKWSGRRALRRCCWKPNCPSPQPIWPPRTASRPARPARRWRYIPVRGTRGGDGPRPGSPRSAPAVWAAAGTSC